ncbi:serine/threonine-protein phosphatase 6 regulatory ankyrin repeat subunit A-like [Patella vulgata]|uniref:serine/threonine-protein phosphatase 6 regulatory ankyrin repeat subunit A-like n=1 Tax=Patella vulgata TaxID=6465 RepID=UPI0024A8E6B7|nr:serine/threonine-protein phosphatase 6 regulatory ankyrin repeat subunit A-like [Patella vulgata]
MAGSIIEAARAGMYKVVLSQIEHCGDLALHYTDYKQENVLHLILHSYTLPAITFGNRHELLQCVIKLVEAGVDVNHLNNYNETPIVIADSYKLYKVVMYLLEHGAHVHYVDINDQDILHHLLYNIYDIDQEDVEQYSKDCIQVVKTLINMGIDVNKPDNRGNIPLFYIARHRVPLTLILFTTRNIIRLQFMLITALISAGCNVNHKNKKRQTPLMYYTRKQVDVSILKLLIEYSDVNLTDNNGDTACSYCFQYPLLNSHNIFKLYSRGVLMSPNNGVKLFHQILACKRLEVFNYYMGLKLIINGPTTEGKIFYIC